MGGGSLLLCTVTSCPLSRSVRVNRELLYFIFFCAVKAAKLHYDVLVILFLGEQTEMKHFSCCIPDFVQ